MEKFKSLIVNTGGDGTITIKLHEGDLVVLLEILEFSARAAHMLTTVENEKGTARGVSKMKLMSRDSDALHGIIFKHLNIGEPDITKIH